MASKALHPQLSPRGVEEKVRKKFLGLYRDRLALNDVRERVAELRPMALALGEPWTFKIDARLAAAECMVDTLNEEARQRLDVTIEEAFHWDLIQENDLETTKAILSLLAHKVLPVSIATDAAVLVALLAKEHCCSCPSLAKGLEGLALVFSRSKIIGSALELSLAGLDHCRRYPERISEVVLLDALASCAKRSLACRQFEEAMSFATTLKNRRIVVGSRETDIALAYDLLARIEADQGLLSQSIESLKKASDIVRRKGLTKESMEVIYNEAVSLMLFGQLDEAEASFMDVLGFYEDAASFSAMTGFDVQKSVANIAQFRLPEVYFLQGKKALAMKVIKDVLFSDKKESDAVWSRAHMIYGDILADSGDLDDALEAYQVSIRIVTCGLEDKRLRGEVTIAIGRALARGEKWEEAIEKLQQGCDMMAGVACHGFPRLVAGLRELSRALREVGRNDEALQKAQEALSMAEIVFGGLHFEVVRCMEVVDACYGV